MQNLILLITLAPECRLGEHETRKITTLIVNQTMTSIKTIMFALILVNFSLAPLVAVLEGIP